MSIDDNRTALDLWQIIAHFGYAHQKEKAIEELNELGQALARDLQGHGSRDNVAEEMADVYIMLGQLELIYGNRDAVAWNITEKIDRTIERVESERTGVTGRESERDQGRL